MPVSRRQNRDVALATVRVTQMACEGSSYTRTAKRSLGVYDLIAAAEWRELISRYSALEQSERTYGQSTQASATLHPSETRASVSAPNAFGVHRNALQSREHK